MESKYKAIKHIGEGAFSSVILALNIETGEKVAIKKMKKRRWKDTAAQAEIGALRKLDHDNIIRLLDVFREDYRSFLVFECMDCDLNELVNSRKGRKLPETVILDITYQVLNGLAFIHENDLFHRDIKPENVLIRRRITPASGPDGNSTIVVEAKIADFGLVHDMDFSRPLTDYISTRWYRAPEVLLNCNNYSTPIDVWAVGTIVAELAMLHPLFPGNNQIDQLRRIFEILGTPKISVPAAAGADESSGSGNRAEDVHSSATGSWYEGAVHARKLGIAFIPSNRKPMPSVMPDVPDYLVQLVDFILVLNPNDRPTATDALQLVSHMLDHSLGQQQQQKQQQQQPQQQPQPQPQMKLPPSKQMPVLTAQSLVIPPFRKKTLPSLPTEASQQQSSAMPAPVRVSPGSGMSGQQTPNGIDSPTTRTVPDSPCTDLPSFASNQQQPAVHDGRVSFTPMQMFAKEQEHHQAILNSLSRSRTNEPQQQQQKQLTSAASDAVGGKPEFLQEEESRPSMEVSITRGFQKEPMIDPRADLSDLVRTSQDDNVNEDEDYAEEIQHVMMRKRSAKGESAASVADCIVPLMRVSTPVSTSVPAPRMVPRSNINSQSFGDEDVDEAVMRMKRISTTFTTRISLADGPTGDVPMDDADDYTDNDFGFDEATASPQSNQFSFSLSDRRMSEDVFHRESSDSYWSGEQNPAQVPVNCSSSNARAGGGGPRRSSAARMRSHTMSSLSSIESLNAQAMDVSPPESSNEYLAHSVALATKAGADVGGVSEEASQRSSAYSNWVSNQAIIGDQSLLSQLAHQELKRSSAASALNQGEKRQQKTGGESPMVLPKTAGIYSPVLMMSDDDAQLSPPPPLDVLNGEGGIGSVGERSSGILEFVNSSVSQARIVPRLVKINQPPPPSARPPVPQRTVSTLPVPLPPAVVAASLPTQPTDPSQGSSSPMADPAMSPNGSLESSKSSSGSKFKMSIPSPRKLKLRGSKTEAARQHEEGEPLPLATRSGQEIQEQRPTPPPVPPKESFMQGLRRKGSMGSPLIKRALSLKKRSNRDLANENNSDNDGDEHQSRRRGKAKSKSKRSSVPQSQLPPVSVTPPRLEDVSRSPSVPPMSLSNGLSIDFGLDINLDTTVSDSDSAGAAATAAAAVTPPLPAVPSKSTRNSTSVRTSRSGQRAVSIAASDDIPLAAELSLSGGLQAHGLCSGSNDTSIATAKQEWLANTYKLRQRIGERGVNRHSSSSEEVKDGSGQSTTMLAPVARKRRSAGCEVRSPMAMRDFLILKSNHKRELSGKSTVSSTHTAAKSRQSVANSIASSIKDDGQSVDSSATSAAFSQKKGAKPPFVQAMAVRRAREAEIAQNSARSAITSRYYPTGSGARRRESLDDAMDLVLAMDQRQEPTARHTKKPSSPYGMTYGAQGNRGESGERRLSEVSDMLIADFDKFADVTFDAGTLFRQSIVDRTAVGALAQPSSVPTNPPAPALTVDRSTGGRARHSRRDGSGGDSSGHRFFSKMRHAFSSRGNNSQHHHQQQQQVDRQSQPLVPQLPPQLPPVGGSQPRRLSEAACVPSQALHHSGTGQAGSSSQAAEQQQRRTLKTSKSAANIGKMAASAAAPPPLLDFDFGSSLLTPESLRKSSSENGPGLAATAATGAQGFLLSGSGSQAAGDNSSQSYLIDYINHDYSDGASCMSADYTASGDSYSRQSVARRIINKNTQVRQTQYEYNFGSQIFDCFDNDFMLLKTDAFNAAGGLDAPSSSLPSSTPAAGTGSGRARPKQGRGAAAGTNRAGGAARKKNVDSVTAAAAYTAAAINSLVANSSKARASVATTTTGDAYQQHRVLIPSALK